MTHLKETSNQGYLGMHFSASLIDDDLVKRLLPNNLIF